MSDNSFLFCTNVFIHKAWATATLVHIVHMNTFQFVAEQTFCLIYAIFNKIHLMRQQFKSVTFLMTHNSHNVYN